MISEIDLNENNQIDYSEFIAATLDGDVLKHKKVLEGLFNQFDLDNDGKIDKDELVKTFSKFGKEITSEEIDTIIKQHDPTGNGEIDMHAF